MHIISEFLQAYIKPECSQIMPFLQILLYTVPPCLLFVILVYFTEQAWKARDAEKRLNTVRRVIQRDAVLVADTRPLVRELPELPWKNAQWK